MIFQNTAVDMMKHTPPAEKFHTTSKPPAVIYTSPSSDRPYVCPYEGCGKNYIHEYKLNLHLKNQHPGHNPEDDVRRGPAVDSTMDDGSDQDIYIPKGGVAKHPKRNKPNLLHKMPPSKLAHPRGSPLTPASMGAIKQQWPNQEMYEEDSEETEEERENVAGNAWRFREVNGDDEETEDEEWSAQMSITENSGS